MRKFYNNFIGLLNKPLIAYSTNVSLAGKPSNNSKGKLWFWDKSHFLHLATFLLLLLTLGSLHAQITPIIHTADDRSASGTGTALSVAKPANLNPGDLIVLIVTTQRSSATVATYSLTAPPTGFTALATQHANTTTDPEIAAYWRIADGTEGANITGTLNNNGTTPNWKAVAIRVSGVNQTTPIAEPIQQLPVWLLLQYQL